MTDKPIMGKKIAVLVEHHYIPDEIHRYQERFGAYGAEVHLMSRLWDQPKICFVSIVNKADQKPETLEVSIDFGKVRLEDYAAVIMAANYASVHLRWFDVPEGQAIRPEMARSAPAVQFFARAMHNKNIVKGAPCHALWLLTPTPELLAGRQVTCNPVVLADVINAGAIYVPQPLGVEWDKQVVADHDLVTNASYRATDLLIDAIKDAILRIEASAHDDNTWPSE